MKTRLPVLLLLLSILSACSGVDTNTPGHKDISVQVPGNFSLTVGQTASLTNYRDVRITLTSAFVGTGPTPLNSRMSEVSPSVNVYVQVPGGCGPDEGCLSPPDNNPPVFTLSGEREILGLVLSVDKVSKGEAWLSIRFRNPSQCEDTDGLNYTTRGSVTDCLIDAGSCRIFEDYCLSSSDLEEYYCGRWQWGSTEYRCPQGCSEGACI